MRKSKSGKVQVNEHCIFDRLNEGFDKNFSGINHETYPPICLLVNCLRLVALVLQHHPRTPTPPPTGTLSGTEQLGAINVKLTKSQLLYVCVTIRFFPTAIIALIGSLACYTVAVSVAERKGVCVCVYVCVTFMCRCGSVLIGLLLSHGLYSLQFWISAFSRLVWWTGLCQLTAYYYTIQSGETGLVLWVASSEP